MQAYKHVNKKYIIVSALVVAGALLVYLSGSSPKIGEVRRGMVQEREVSKVVHPATVMQADLYPSLDSPEKVPVVKEKVYGGIVSHHFYMEGEIGKLFLELRGQKPSVVVIVGPNHFNAGRGDILVSKAAYNTPFGQLEPAIALANQLLDDQVVLFEETPFEREHSIVALVGFIKKIWPDTRLLPIIIKRNTTGARTEKLAAELSEILPKDALVLASVDFSHHLDRFAAEFHDSQSVSALLGADIARIRNLEVDSPQSLEVLVRFLQSKNALQMSYTNTNQAVYSGNLLSDDVTSYVFAKFAVGSTASGSSPKVGEVRRGMITDEQNITFMHFGNYDASVLSSDEGKSLYTIAGPENNLFRGADLKVLGTTDCQAKNVPALAPYQIKLFNIGTCSGSAPVGTTITHTSIGFARVGNASELMDTVTRLLNTYNNVVVQTASRALAEQAIDIGAGAVFVEASTPKIEIYKGRPIIYLAKAGESGFSVGVSFGARSILYVFPYEIKNAHATRLSIEERLKVCGQVLAGLPKFDGCQAEVR